MKKSHPLRRVVLAGAATVSGIVLLLSLKPSSDPGSAQAAGAAAQEAAQGGAGAAVSGAITGDASQTQYGAVQVRVTVSNGKITKAETVQAPKGGQSDQITADAVPKLNQAALTAQSADIDAVSGATFTSEGYKKSLQSAIDKMKASAGASQGAAGAAPVSGTFDGDAAQTQYGAVQVRITVSNNQITKAETVQAPKGGQSDQITADAVPKLNQAVVTKQSPDIDAVSGATYTSTGYKQSLQSAIDKANASAGAQGSGAQEGSKAPEAPKAPEASKTPEGSGNAQAGGTFTGEAVQTQYGTVQVRITVSGGKITKAETVQAPKGGQSDQITADAVPKLNRAAVAAGSADIDAVSGATYTSGGYKESLQSALDQAGG
ncbi:FMN-binding protein [Streptomyces phaeoluteigriseus]|uniref:FMN-binding protein n=1 Tax=Streptomyces phaeoluteigriseus TaxID=114686 RepID=A0A1V6MP98_9ACTN|nr:FMN-binding protein [Streptomyces phaeoluteigriseus]OQD54290.1 FMN-binding protein [Streptomyces phaeoluteigriseus]